MKYLIIPSTIIMMMLFCTYLGYKFNNIALGIICGGIFSIMYLIGSVIKK